MPCLRTRIKQYAMKLSQLTIGFLIAGAALVNAQNDGNKGKQNIKPKKELQNNHKERRSIAADSVKVNKTKPNPGICGPCGMG